jgi:hypothetical protein
VSADGPLHHLADRPGIYSATRNAGPTATAVLDRVFEPACNAFLAAVEQHRLIRGRLGKKRQRRTLERIAFFYLSAGVSLMTISTSQGDDC